MRRGIAEFVGTFTLIFIGGGAGIVSGNDIVAVALANGLAIAIMVTNLGHISGGHFNPSITLGFLATRRITVPLAISYWASQLAGAVEVLGERSHAPAPVIAVAMERHFDRFLVQSPVKGLRVQFARAFIEQSRDQGAQARLVRRVLRRAAAHRPAQDEHCACPSGKAARGGSYQSGAAAQQSPGCPSVRYADSGLALQVRRHLQLEALARSNRSIAMKPG